MKAINSFLPALKYAIEFVFKKKLYIYFLPAFALAFFFYFAFSGGNALAERIAFMEDWWGIGWFIKASESIISFIAFVVFEFIILTLLSPVNSYFAEKVREDVTGEKAEFSIPVFLRSLWRMIVILFVGLILQLGLTIVLWLFSFLFGDFFYEIASMLNVAFFIGFTFFDFGLELDEVNSKKSWKFARKHWSYCILLGLIFNVSIYYPQKHDWILLYLIGIVIMPHLLTIAASKMYFSMRPVNPADLNESEPQHIEEQNDL